MYNLNQYSNNKIKYNANHFKVLTVKRNAFLNPLELINLEKANCIKKLLRMRYYIE